MVSPPRQGLRIFSINSYVGHSYLHANGVPWTGFYRNWVSSLKAGSEHQFFCFFFWEILTAVEAFWKLFYYRNCNSDKFSESGNFQKLEHHFFPVFSLSYVHETCSAAIHLLAPHLIGWWGSSHSFTERWHSSLCHCLYTNTRSVPLIFIVFVPPCHRLLSRASLVSHVGKVNEG